MTHLYKLTDRQVDAIRTALGGPFPPLVNEEKDDLIAALGRKVEFSGAVRHFSELQAINDPELHAYADAAREQHHRDGELEIDEQGPVAIVSKGEDAGAYVMAWVWVDDTDAGIEAKDDEA